MRSLGSPASGSCSSPAWRRARATSTRSSPATGELRLKADPLAFAAEVPPQDRVGRPRVRHEWADAEWLERAAPDDPLDAADLDLRGPPRLVAANPLEGNRSLTYLELADELAAYANDMGFTHVELMPVMAHPFSGSWGYQVTGYFAPTPRYGSPDEFRAVRRPAAPARPRRDPRLGPRALPARRLRARALRRHRALRARRPAPRRAPDWGTLVFNFGRNEVRNFLLANALYWLREYHADGIRVDAVASMLYLDYSREEGEWVPNEFGGNEDLDAVAFLKELNEVVHAREPGVDLRGRGVDRVAGRLAPDLPRRPRLRLQVEHGLDARHARVLPAGPGPPPLAPPRADLLARLRVHRELHPAALARRGRARQGLAAVARCRATAGRSSRTCARCTPTCGRTPARSCCSWATSSPRSRSGATSARSTGTCSRTRSTPASSRSCATSTASTATSPRCGSATSTARLLLARAQRRREQRVRVRAARPTTPSAVRLRRQPLAGAAQRLPARPAASRAAGARRSTPTPTSTAARTSATSAASQAEDVPWMDQPLGGAHAAAARRVWLVPEDA